MPKQIIEWKETRKGNRRCMHCGSCIAVCLNGALKFNKQNQLVWTPAKCSGCLLCVKACPEEVLQVKK